MKTYKPPKSVAKRAKLARKWKKKYPDSAGEAGTRVGWYRSAQLSKRKPVTLETIKRMANFFNRHDGNQEYSGKPYEDNGKVMWEAWGGDAGRRWAEKILREEGVN
ncbi:MAG: hypothetical protein ACOCRO_09800 [Halanaerobiales bacterium]